MLMLVEQSIRFSQVPILYPANYNAATIKLHFLEIACICCHPACHWTTHLIQYSRRTKPTVLGWCFVHQQRFHQRLCLGSNSASLSGGAIYVQSDVIDSHLPHNFCFYNLSDSNDKVQILHFPFTITVLRQQEVCCMEEILIPVLLAHLHTMLIQMTYFSNWQLYEYHFLTSNYHM